ncbi:MAG: hypothetical protein ABSA62_04460 [Methyloceanibacter sp.]
MRLHRDLQKRHVAEEARIEHARRHALALASNRTPRWRTQTMASAPSPTPLAGKLPSAVLAVPCSMRAGNSFRSETVRAARMSLGAR